MNQLDKLIAKFCAPDEDSPRPVHYVAVKPYPREVNRSQLKLRILMQILKAIDQAERTAIAHRTPMPSKTQIMSELGMTSNVLDRNPAALRAYTKACDRCLAALS